MPGTGLNNLASCARNGRGCLQRGVPGFRRLLSRGRFGRDVSQPHASRAAGAAFPRRAYAQRRGWCVAQARVPMIKAVTARDKGLRQSHQAHSAVLAIAQYARVFLVRARRKEKPSLSSWPFGKPAGGDQSPAAPVLTKRGLNNVAARAFDNTGRGVCPLNMRTDNSSAPNRANCFLRMA